MTPKRDLSAEELARREANQEKAQPYIERRLALGLSQVELAQRAGVDKSTVRGMESGRYWPCWDTRQKLRRALGMPEERSYTEKERNTLFLGLEDSIRWLIRRNMSRICRVHMDTDDLYQDLAVCALRAIDRFQPDGAEYVISLGKAAGAVLYARLVRESPLPAPRYHSVLVGGTYGRWIPTGG